MSNNLWAPWRMEYIQRFENSESATLSDSECKQKCFLCDAVQAGAGSKEAQERYVLINDERGVALLNLYPYTNGHLLVAPRDHVSGLGDLSAKQRSQLMELTTHAEMLLRNAVNPQGVNIGINLGRCAGAGLPGHLHVHLVPRWSGDTNFMQTVGHVRVIPEALKKSYDRFIKIADTLNQG